MRLALWYGLSLLILLTVFVAVLYTTVHFGLHRDFDRRLREEAQAMRQHLQAHPDVSHALSVSSTGLEGSAASDTFVRTLDESGNVLRASAPRPGPSLAPDLPSTQSATMRRHSWNGRSARTLYVPLNGEPTSAQWLAVTKLDSALHRQLHRLRWLLVLGIFLGAGGAVAIGYGLARRALHPVAALTDAANEMKGRPTGTLPTDFGTEDELSDLAETFNDLFRRLRETIARERRFRADAAHKMFTPLTAIQNEIDVTLRTDRSASAYREALETVRTHTDELSSMLDQLMTLSRAEARERGPAEERIDVTQRVKQRAERARGKREGQNVSLSVEGEPPVRAAVREEHIEVIVDHLLDNALKYTPEGETVRVSVRQRGDTAVLRVADTGLGFDPDEADRLFDRFYRGAEADDTARGGGLGLSVVQALVHSYEGAVSARSDGPGEGSTFEVRLPVGP